MESKLYLLYKEFILSKSIYNPSIFNDTPQKIAEYPTVTFVEDDNYDSDFSTERSECTEVVRYIVNIYTKDKTYDGEKKARKLITTELKEQTKLFFRMCGLKMTSCTKGEYLDFNVDRLIMIAEGTVNSWNGMIR